MSERVRMPRQPMFAAGDLTVASVTDAARDARRFSMTVADEALMRAGPIAIEAVIQKLSEEIAHEQRPALEATVQSFLRDRAWAEPIIRDAIRETVRECVLGIMGNSIFGQAAS